MHVMTATEQAFESADPELAHPNIYDAIRNQLNEITSSAAAFNQTSSVQYLLNANGYADAIPPLLVQIPRLVDGKNAARAGLTVRQLRRQVDETTAALEKRAAETDAAFNKLAAFSQSLTESIAQQQTRLDAQVARFEDQFSRAEEARRDVFAKAEDERRELATATDKLTTERLDAAIAALRTRVEAEGQSMSEYFQALRSNAMQRSMANTADLEKLREQAAKIVGLISETGMIHGFQKVADAEEKAARYWQRLATWSMVFLAVFAVGSFLESFFHPFTWGILSNRVFVALTVGLLVAYAARQSDRHEAVQRQSRRQELELAALDPFLLPLPEADRNAVKKAMAEKMFGQRDESRAPEVGDTKEFSGSVFEALRLLAETVKQVTAKK